MSWAVHGLQGEAVLLDLEGEHVLMVILPVARGLPEPAVVHVGGEHFGEVPLVVLLLEDKGLHSKPCCTRPGRGQSNHSNAGGD